MRKRTLSKWLLAAVLLASAALTVACQGGVGVGLGYSYPGRIYEVGGGGSWGGGPVWN